MLLQDKEGLGEKGPDLHCGCCAKLSLPASGLSLTVGSSLVSPGLALPLACRIHIDFCIVRSLGTHPVTYSWVLGVVF